MTFNIRYGTADDGADRWEERRGMVFDVLRAQAPAILCLQEALRFQLDEIRAALSDYEEAGVGRDDGKSAGEYSAILFRADRFELLSQGTFWYSDTPNEPGTAHWGNNIPRICTRARLRHLSSGRRFTVFNTHLDHESQASRERSATALSDSLRNASAFDALIVTGDFNAGEENRVIGILTGRHSGAKPRAGGRVRLIDTYRAAHPGAAAVGTYHAFRGDSTGEKIDFIFTDTRARVVEASILRDHPGTRYPSDHFPVTARLAYPACEER